MLPLHVCWSIPVPRCVPFMLRLDSLTVLSEIIYTELPTAAYMTNVCFSDSRAFRGSVILHKIFTCAVSVLIYQLFTVNLVFDY